ncbi:MAG: hypothetical protein HY811_08015 [Planctomycetes bacterium]|nr:hypothetical protein [Planctomycetota bacterium]
MIRFFLVTCLVAALGCASQPYRESIPVPPPSRFNYVHKPSTECSPVCIQLSRIQKLEHPLDRVKELLKVAEMERLSCHDQLYLIEVALPIEMFSAEKVFTKLAGYKYLCYSVRDALLNYAERLNVHERKQLIQLLQENKGVPDSLTPMEKLWTEIFSEDNYTILGLYKEGFKEEDNLVILYLNKTAPVHKRVDVLARWRKSWDKVTPWHKIITEDLSMDATSLFIPLAFGSEVPQPFKSSYSKYWIGISKDTVLSDEEISLLIRLKTLCIYYLNRRLARELTEAEVVKVMGFLSEGKSPDEIAKGLEK